MRDPLARTALRAVQLLVIAAAVWVVLTLLGRILVIVVPVILAVFLTTVLEPPASWLRRRGAPSWVATRWWSSAGCSPSVASSTGSRRAR